MVHVDVYAWRVCVCVCARVIFGLHDVCVCVCVHSLLAKVTFIIGTTMKTELLTVLEVKAHSPNSDGCSMNQNLHRLSCNIGTATSRHVAR